MSATVDAPRPARPVVTSLPGLASSAGLDELGSAAGLDGLGRAAGLDGLGRAAGPGAVAFPPSQVTSPGIWSVVGAWQQSSRRPVPIVLDAVVVALAALTVGTAGHRSVAVPLAVLAAVAAGLVFGVYRHRSVVETQGVGWFLLPAVLTAAAVGGSLYGTQRLFGKGRPSEAAVGAAAVVAALLASRTVLWVALSHARRHGHGLTPTLVVGPADRVEQVRRRLGVFPDAGLCFAGGYTPGSSEAPDGALEAVERLTIRHDAVQVLVVADRLPENVVRDVARYAGPQVDCAVVPPVGALCGVRVRHRIGDLGVIPVFIRPSWGREKVKRVVDVLLASTALALCWPILIVTALAVRLHDRGPALFRQDRVGRDGQLFTVVKFRTMDVDAEARKATLREVNALGGLLFKLGGDPRVTPIGDVLRRTAIDELPQLLNVLRGEMSLVGPRPLPAVADDFDSLAQIRHEVRPGMTGLWQVRGGNALPYSEMLDLDLAYVLGRSLGLDLKIMVQTVPALLVRRSVY